MTAKQLFWKKTMTIYNSSGTNRRKQKMRKAYQNGTNITPKMLRLSRNVAKNVTFQQKLLAF
jgi:hypothetical protein